MAPLTCELWDLSGAPLLRTECATENGKPPLMIAFRPVAEPDVPPRHFRLAMLDREAVIFIYQEVREPTTTLDSLLDKLKQAATPEAPVRIGSSDCTGGGLDDGQ